MIYRPNRADRYLLLNSRANYGKYTGLNTYLLTLGKEYQLK